MERDTVSFLVWIVGPVLVITAVILSFIFPAKSGGEWDIRVGGHHDPVTGEFHGITHHFHRSPDVTWYADCPKCIADRDRWDVNDDFGWDPYEAVRGEPSMVKPESGKKDESTKGVP